MTKNLVIVESPAKAKTIKKYLGRDFEVMASYGHVRDLVPKEGAVDPERGFAMRWEVIDKNRRHVEAIERAVKKADALYLSTDPDREGEAISWHLRELLKEAGVLDGKAVHRSVFYEITQNAVRDAVNRPREIAEDLVKAYLARRALDYLVGFKVSPMLWRKAGLSGASAGRVQSPALRMICEREAEILAFKPREYWTVDAQAEKGEQKFSARLSELGGRKVEQFTITDGARAAEARAAIEQAAAGALVVGHVERKQRKRNPSPPFTTSTLQQEAARKLGFGAQRTMRIAQRLYEGVELGDEGAVGLITYMRTDSTRISGEAIGAAREYIQGRFGGPYLPEQPNVYKSKKDAQDAHEAIRPTSMQWEPEKVAPFVEKDELALYTLIWNRFVASQMASAVFDATAIDLEAGECRFRATGQILKFDGFIRVYTEGRDDESTGDDDAEGQLPELAEGEKVKLLELVPEQHFTQPPPRFTQATLIKELEEQGIGRPSTYATIVGTILNKEYVHEDDSRRLRPTELGFLVTDLLVAAFPDVLNVEFTASMEDDLDRIEEGKEHWVTTMKRFWEPFAKDLERASVEMRDVKREERPTGLKCEKCGNDMVVKWGRRGEFLACKGYPECRNTMNFTRDDDGNIKPAEIEIVDEKCEKCGRPMQVRFGRYGKFLGCTGYPECSNMQPLHKPVPTGVKCIVCNEGEYYERRSRRGKLFYSCSRYPECQAVVWDKPVLQPCPRCQAPFVTEKVTKRYGTIHRCVKEGCGWQEQLPNEDGSEVAPLPERREAAKRRPPAKRPGKGAVAEPAASGNGVAAAEAGNGATPVAKKRTKSTAKKKAPSRGARASRQATQQ